MNQKNKQRLIILSLLCVLVFLGFYREFLFYNIQAEEIFQKKLHHDRYTDSSLNWLTKLNLNELLQLRWILTLVFTICFGFISFLVIHFSFKSKRYNKWIVKAFTGALVAAIIFYGISPNYDQKNTAYLMARKIMGLLQSPLLLMALIPPILLDLNLNSNNDQNS